MLQFKSVGFVCICVGLSTVSIGEVNGQSNPAAAGQSSVVQFPQDRSLGTLYAAPLEAMDEGKFNWFKPEFKSIGIAQGEVEFPAHSLIRLDVSLDACKDLSPLSEIPPDSIQGLYFNINSDPSGQYEHIGALTGLRFLYFRSVPVTDGQILKLAGLTNLEQFMCSVNGFQDKGFGIHDRALRVIARFKKLKYLYLRSNPITDEGLRLLLGCQALEVLSLDGTKVTGAGFDKLLKLPNLKSLNLGSYQNGAPVDDDGMKILCQMRQLTGLSLGGTQISDEGMKHISNLDNLENLSLDFTDVTPDGLRFLAGLKKLKSLRFQSLDDTAAKHLSSASNLERVIGKWKLSEAGYRDLAQLKKLKSLSFSDNVTDRDLVQIAKMESLERLSFHRCPISDQGLVHLADLKNLKILSVFRSEITGAGLKAIGRLPNLTTLEIEFKKFGPAVNWNWLGEMSELNNLTLGSQEFDKLAFVAIGKLKNLERLMIEDAIVGPEFFEAVAGLSKLNSLDFQVDILNDDSCRKLAGLKDLEYLDLHGDILDHQLLLLADLPNLRLVQNHSKLLTLGGIQAFMKQSKSLQSFLHPLLRE